jgi:hypothetical protein
MTNNVKDLLILAADRDMEYTLHGLLTRQKSLQIRPVSYDIFTHPQRDPGCWNDAHNFLRPFTKQYDYALVLFDHVGSGQEKISVDRLVPKLEEALKINGWKDEHAKVIVLQPELEVWVWGRSPKIDECLGWAGRRPDLRTWLRAKTWWDAEEIKPAQPKEAMQAALREVRKPLSPALYQKLAEQVSFKECADPAFQRLWSILKAWFPSNDSF